MENFSIQGSVCRKRALFVMYALNVEKNSNTNRCLKYLFVKPFYEYFVFKGLLNAPVSKRKRTELSPFTKNRFLGTSTDLTLFRSFNGFTAKIVSKRLLSGVEMLPSKVLNLSVYLRVSQFLCIMI